MEDFYIWEGIYNSFDEAPRVGEGFASKKYIESTLSSTVRFLEGLKNPEDISNIPFDISSLYIISSELYSQNNKLKILDFGGGMGISYAKLKQTLPKNKNINYTIIENAEVCKVAKGLFEDDANIIFCDKLPRKSSKFDIIYVSSALQYVDDWQDLLKSFSEYSPKYLIIDNTNIGEIKRTYVTSQNYYESKIPCRFFNIDDMKSEMLSNNYKLIFKSNFKANILGKYGHKPQDNFPKEYRVNFGKNLIFKEI